MCGAMNTSFWNNPSQWPRDAADAIFLARAFHEIGRAMFGLSWTGKEPSVELPLHKPGPLKAKFASDALRAQAEMVQEKVGQRYEDVLPLYDRAQQVQATIATRAAAGEIKTKLRPVAGGRLADIPAHYWDTEKLLGHRETHPPFCLVPNVIGRTVWQWHGRQWIWVHLHRAGQS